MDDENPVGAALPSNSCVPQDSRGPGPGLLLLAAGLAGAGIMTVELAAVRLIAPRFGASSAVWTNVIGVVLLSLSLGYLLGARASRGPNPARSLGRVLLIGAACTAWLPALAGPVCAMLFPDGTILGEAVGLLVMGSLAASIVLFLPAATVLGCASPLCTEALHRQRGGAAGESGGRVLAAGTVGSLVGAFGTTYALIPHLDLTGIFLAAGGALAFAGLLVSRAAGGLRSGAVWLVPLFAAFGLSRMQTRDVREGELLLASRQSSYQSLRVVETGVGADAFRRLKVNEGLDSFQSVWAPNSGLLGGMYYDLFALPPSWEGAPKEWSTLVLGLGAGTTVRVMEGALPTNCKLRTVGIELDPEVIALAREYFDLVENNDRVVHAGLDARVALALDLGLDRDEGFDQVALDCYANQVEIPQHLATLEFFREVEDVLRPGGWLTINAAGFGLDDPVVRAVAETCATAFEQDVVAVQVPFSRNCMLFVRRGTRTSDPEDVESWNRPDARFESLLRSLALEGNWCRVVPGAPDPLTDSFSPMERLQLESLTTGHKRWIEGQP